MAFGIKNTVIPPAPEVNDVDFNTIALVGIAPKGPTQTLTVCASDTDDSQFGKCLTGFNIPRALSTIRSTGAGKVVVVNVFDDTVHTSQVTHENATVTAQVTKTAFNPTNAVEVKNTPVSPVSPVGATNAMKVATGAGAGDTLTQITVDGTNLFASTLTFTSGTQAQTATQIVAHINAHTSTSGFSATAGSSGNFTVTGPTSLGATLNGVIPVLGTITGTVAFDAPVAFANGVTEVIAVTAVTYVKDTDYTIDEYGNIKFLIAVSDASVVRLTYQKLNAAAVTASYIVGSVSGSTRTGLKLIDACANVLGYVPKILICPGYNALQAVQVEMERLATEYRMRTAYGSTSGLTLANAIASRNPGGSLATFNTSSKRARVLFPLVKTYDPQSASMTLDDPSAAWAGFLAYNAAVNGPHVSISNQVNPAVGGAEISLLHKWEDASNAGETNQLRAAGVSCLFNDGGWKHWGAENASYPSNSAVDCNETVIYTNDVITDALTAFAKQYVDKNITSGSISSAVTAMNGYYSSLMTRGWIGTDSKVSFKKERNPDADLKLGKVRFTRNTFYFVGMKLIELEENMEVQLPTV